MMSKTKWILLLILFIIYLLLGASFFYKIESEQEDRKLELEAEERKVIQDILRQHFHSEPEHERILLMLSDYCGKSMMNTTNDAYDSPPKWDFYHSVFFAFTVVTTIGYGNLAPTTAFSRIFMILYGLIGIPINGILFATLGEFFGHTFIRVYKKWKNSKVKDYAASLGLVSQIILYLIPGFAIFIFLPAAVIMHFENWDYTLSVYYSFVTLTTIGFGDYVAGVTNQGFHGIYFMLYQIFLLIWIIFGLGYLVMIIGFITRGLRSKKMILLEKQLAQNIKSTQSKIWHGFVKDLGYLRRIMNELYMAKFKPVYRDECACATQPKIGSQSFPDLRKLIAAEMSPTQKRRRAFSECITTNPITRVQSDTDLSRIDKEATFASLGMIPSADLLVSVANALSGRADDSESETELGIHGFSDSEILASEMYGSSWTIGSNKIPAQAPKLPRTRASSEVKIPAKIRQDSCVNEWTWSGPYATQELKNLRRNTKRQRINTDNVQNTSKSLFERIKNTVRRNKEEQNKDIDVEKQQNNTSTISPEQESYLNRTRGGRASVFSVPEARVLEETSLADLLRALTSLHSRIVTDAPEPKRKLGTVTPPNHEPSIMDLFTQPRPLVSRNLARRGSMTPSATNLIARRRFSLHPVTEDQLMSPPPPPYSPTTSLPPPGASGTRRFSQFGVPPPNLVHKQISRLRGPANARILYTRTRHNSLKDIRIDKP